MGSPTTLLPTLPKSPRETPMLDEHGRLTPQWQIYFRLLDSLKLPSAGGITRYVIAYDAAGHAIPNGNGNTIHFDTNVKDTSSFHPTGAGNDTFTIPATGLYLIHGQITIIDDNTSGTYRDFFININSAGTIMYPSAIFKPAGVAVALAGDTRIQVTGIAWLAAADTVNFEYSHDSGITVHTDNNGFADTYGCLVQLA